MDPSFIPIETVPSKTPFGLDQLRRSYKTALDAASAIAAAPNVGDADEVFPFMFLMPISTPESAESATRVDLIYQGCFRDDGAGHAILPDVKHESDFKVASASSQNGPIGGFSLASPVTLQFYAPTSTQTFFSIAEETTSSVSAPSGDIQIIAMSFAANAIPFGFSGDLFAFFRYNFFIEITTSTIKSTEVVPGQYWLNVDQKTKVLVPFQYTTAFNLVLNNPGSGYTIGDVLTISGGGGSGTATVNAVDGSGAILLFYTTANTFTGTATGVSASGGTGSGATFDITA